MSTFNNTQTQGHELDWDSTIAQEEQEYIPLEVGNYIFEVVKFERARTKGGKLPPCSMAKIELKLSTLDGQQLNRKINYNLILHSSLEWRLSQFFEAIGLKQKGQPLIMDWNKVPGARGVCEIGKRDHEGKIYDDIKKCLGQDEAKKAIEEYKTKSQNQIVAPSQNTTDYPW